MSDKSKTSESELDRLLALSNLGIDYYESKSEIQRLTEIAAKITGAEICLINLLDSFTQWTISAVGFEPKQMPVENSVCRYTITQAHQTSLEILDLSEDNRFSAQTYVAGDLGLRYYLGVPLTTEEGFNIGALCVMDKSMASLSDEKKEILKLIADQVVEQLQMNRMVLDLNWQIKELTSTKNKLAHDLRGPIGGIIGLSEIIIRKESDNTFEEMMSFFSLINSSGKSIIDLTDSILQSSFDAKSIDSGKLADSEITLVALREKIEQLFAPQALLKKINLEISFVSQNELVSFNKHLIFQIIGNLVSNSIKFTPEKGTVSVNLELKVQDDESKQLFIKIKDTGMGISKDKIQSILHSNSDSELGTAGEKGFGLGLNLVKVLLDRLGGEMKINSELNKGTEFQLEMNVV